MNVGLQTIIFGLHPVRKQGVYKRKTRMRRNSPAYTPTWPNESPRLPEFLVSSIFSRNIPVLPRGVYNKGCEGLLLLASCAGSLLFFALLLSPWSSVLTQQRCASASQLGKGRGRGANSGSWYVCKETAAVTSPEGTDTSPTSFFCFCSSRECNSSETSLHHVYTSTSIFCANLNDTLVLFLIHFVPEGSCKTWVLDCCIFHDAGFGTLWFYNFLTRVS
jgi:hypothetical protein